MLRLPAIFLILLSSSAWAQQTSAAAAFFGNLADCAASLGGWKCLELDLSSELTDESDTTKSYEYSWDFGDGQRLQGMKIEHCYEDFGSYQVTMNLLDMETNTVIRNELSSTVHLYPEIFPAIDVRTVDQAPSFIGFNYKEVDDFTPDGVFWRIDGQYYEGTSVVHSFPVAGNYLIEMGVEKDMGFLGTVTACATKEITVKDSDLWTNGMRNAIRQKRATAKTGPYASDEIFCRITEASSQEGHVLPLSALMRQVDLQEGKTYELLMFTGNFFTESAQFSTQGISGNDLYVALKDQVTAAFDKPLTALEPIRFAGDQMEVVDTLNLKKSAEILLRHPYLKVEIGAYLHTGSRFSSGVATSLLRSAAVKKALTKLGVSGDRIAIASPEFNQSLINTCSALPDCPWERRELNGKVELKIIGCL